MPKKKDTTLLLLRALLVACSCCVTRIPLCSALRNRSPLSHGNLVNGHDRLQHVSNGDSKTLLRGGDGSSSTILPHTEARRRKLVVLLVSTALFNDMLQLTMLLPIIHTLISSPPPLGVTSNKEMALGIFFASKDVCQMAFAPIAGLLTARTSPNAALALSTAGLGLATFVFAEATTFRQLLVARGAQGAASAAVLCGGLSLIAATYPAEARGSAMGLAQTGLALGLLGGPLVGGLLFSRLGRRRTFRLAAGIVLANAAAMAGLMGLQAPPEGRERATAGRGETPPTARTEGSLMSSTQKLLANRHILAVTASTFAIHAVVGVIKPISQVVLDTEFGITMVKRSFIISIATVSYFVTAPFSGWLSDRMSRSRLVASSLVLMAGSSGLFALRHLGIWSFYVCVALLGVALGMQKSSSQSLLADLVDEHDLGEYSMVYALSDVADSLGLVLGPLVGLWLSQIFSHSTGVLAMGALCLFLAPALLRIE